MQNVDETSTRNVARCRKLRSSFTLESGPIGGPFTGAGCAGDRKRRAERLIRVRAHRRGRSVTGWNSWDREEKSHGIGGSVKKVIVSGQGGG